MPNITVTVDEPVYQRARIAAALRNTTVTQLVREYLGELDRQTAQHFSTDNSGLAEHLGLRAIEPYVDIHRPHLREEVRQPGTKHALKNAKFSPQTYINQPLSRRHSAKKTHPPSPTPVTVKL